MLKFNTVNLVFGSILVIFLFLSWKFQLPIGLSLIIVIIWLTITALGSANIQWNYFLDSKSSNPNENQNRIAITFDDGPNPVFTPKILKILSKYNAKATFFCIGKHAKKHPEIIQLILKEGHTIGNHTYLHSNNYGILSTKNVTADLSKSAQILENISGEKIKLYRPAFGVTNPRISSAVKKLNLTSIGWNVRSLDTTKRDENQVFKRIKKNIKQGDIILLHDTSEKTVLVLERLLLFLQEKNLQSVTVDQLLKIKAYA